MPKMSGRSVVVGSLEIQMEYRCHPAPGLGTNVCKQVFTPQLHTTKVK